MENHTSVIKEKAKANVVGDEIGSKNDEVSDEAQVVNGEVSGVQ